MSKLLELKIRMSMVPLSGSINFYKNNISG